jgi:hypothetical protein
MNDRLNHAVERLLSDDRFLRRFRRNPDKALAPLELTHEEIAAVKSGHARELVRLGLDPKYVWPGPPVRNLGVQLLMRAKRITPALAFIALAVPAAPALAANATRTRARRRSRIARVSRYFGRAHVSGNFHAFLARSGIAGRVISRAATCPDASLFSARARRAARAFGIQLPPPPGSN